MRNCSELGLLACLVRIDLKVKQMLHKFCSTSCLFNTWCSSRFKLKHIIFRYCRISIMLIWLTHNFDFKKNVLKNSKVTAPLPGHRSRPIFQAADHPGHLMLPETRYLRALLLHLVWKTERERSCLGRRMAMWTFCGLKIQHNKCLTLRKSCCGVKHRWNHAKCYHLSF